MSHGNERSVHPHQPCSVYWPAAQRTRLAVPIMLKSDATLEKACRVEVPTPEQIRYMQRILLTEGLSEMLMRLDPHLYEETDGYYSAYGET